MPPLSADKGNSSDSLAVLQNAYNAHPGAIRPMVDLVNGYLQSGQPYQAETFIRSVLADNPANAEALVLMGSIQLAKKAPAEAEKFFKLAIEKSPADAAGYRALADLYARQKKTDDALNLIRAGLKQQPNNFALHLTLAGLLEAKGEYDAAIAEYESMLKDQPGSLIIANNLASLLADHRTDKTSLERANSLAMLLKNSDSPAVQGYTGLGQLPATGLPGRTPLAGRCGKRAAQSGDGPLSPRDDLSRIRARRQGVRGVQKGAHAGTQ